MADHVAKGSLSEAKKRRNDKSPTHIGSLTVNQDVKAGQKLWLAAWLNQAPDGQEYLSIHADFPQERNEQPAPPQRSGFGMRSTQPDDDIPF